MAEELYFFKIDWEKIKHKLVPLLKIFGTFSFSNYINNPIQYSKIIDKIDKNITELDPDDYFEIWDWFYEKAKNRKVESSEYSLELSSKVKNDMIDCGLIYFKDIPSKTSVRKFYEILSDYESLSKNDIDIVCSKEEFENFLNYLICYTGELSMFLNKFYYKRLENYSENLDIKKLIKRINSTNSFAHSFVLSELKNENKQNIETIKMTQKLKQFRQENKHKSVVTLTKELKEISDREDDLLNKASMFYYGIGLKEDLKDYNDIVIRLHSF